MEGQYLENVLWHTWEGLADPENDPDPQKFRVFRWWPGLSGYGFRAEFSFSALIETGGQQQSLRIEFADTNGAAVCDTTQSFFLPMSDLRDRFESPHPPPHMIARVMSSDDAAEWYLNGYTNLRVFAEIVWESLGVRLEAVGPVLEWGSGCSLLSRHLIRGGYSMVGIDIDKEAVDWCNANLTQTGRDQAKFITCGLFPPTNLVSDSFGLAIGISVITHLDEAAANAWLAELARLLRPGGICLLTTQGLDTFSANSDARIYRAIRHDGIFSVGSGHLDAVLGKGQDYYRETFHGWDYIRNHWNKWFEVVTIRRGGHLGYQDLVVLKRNGTM